MVKSVDWQIHSLWMSPDQYCTSILHFKTIFMLNTRSYSGIPSQANISEDKFLVLFGTKLPFTVDH